MYFLNNLNKTLANINQYLTAVLFKGSGELSDSCWDFESCQEDSFLPLEGDVFGPFNESGEVSGRLDVVSESEVSWSLLEKRVGFLFNSLDSSFSFSSFTLHISHILP